MKKRTFVLWKKIIKRTIFSVLFFGTFYIYFYTNIFTIYNYEIVGAPTSAVNEIQNKLQELSSHPLYKIIPSNKILTYRGSKIKSIIKDSLPDTNTITINTKSFHTLKITITPYIPLFRMNKLEAITKEGYVFKPSKELIELPNLTVSSSTIKSESKDGLIANKLVIDDVANTELLFISISNIIPKVNTVLFNVTNINILPHGDVFIANESMTSMVKLTYLLNLDKEWSNVISAVDTEPLKGLLLSKKDQFEYVDVRFDNKVFYKFTNTLIPSIISASTTKNYVQKATTTPTTSH